MGAIINILGTVASAIVSVPGLVTANPIESAAVAAGTAIVGYIAKKADKRHD